MAGYGKDTLIMIIVAIIFGLFVLFNYGCAARVGVDRTAPYKHAVYPGEIRNDTPWLVDVGIINLLTKKIAFRGRINPYSSVEGVMLEAGKYRFCVISVYDDTHRMSVDGKVPPEAGSKWWIFRIV